MAKKVIHSGKKPIKKGQKVIQSGKKNPKKK
jgi:hypothetical protein